MRELSFCEIDLVFGGSKTSRHIQLEDKCKSDINQGVNLGMASGVAIGAAIGGAVGGAFGVAAGMMLGKMVAMASSASCRELEKEVQKSKNYRIYVGWGRNR